MVEAGEPNDRWAEIFSDPAAFAPFFVAANSHLPIPDASDCHQFADDYLRICCFTNPEEVRPADEILLWSHYAAKHAGVRIEFDFDPEITAWKSSLGGVIYATHRVPINYYAALFGGAMNLSETIFTKCEAWRYEAEVRLVASAVNIESQDGRPGVGYVQFEPSWVSAVDFGINCPEDDIARICGILSEKYPKNVVRRRAVRHASEFLIEYKPIGS